MSAADAGPAPVQAALSWRCQRFATLTVLELQAVFMARQRVFVVEQACAYQDADGIDEHCWHLGAWTSDGEPVAYARLVDPGVKYAEASIGRVLTTSAARGRGLGRELMRHAVDEVRRRHPGFGIRISAQSHLERFYRELGFETCGGPYLEDDIPHLEMLAPPG